MIYREVNGAKERSTSIRSHRPVHASSHLPSSTVASEKVHLKTSLSGSPMLEIAVKVVLRNGSATIGHLECSTGGYSFVAVKLNASAVAYGGVAATTHRRYVDSTGCERNDAQSGKRLKMESEV